MSASPEVGELFFPGEEPLVAPGVRALVFDTPNGIYIPMIIAEREGAGDVGRYLASLPTDRRVVFPTVISARLRGMLERRGYKPRMEWAPEMEEHVEIYERRPQMTETPAEAWKRGAEYVRRQIADDWSFGLPDYRPLPPPDEDTPAQAWYRGAALMRAAVHAHGKLADDSPRWSFEIPAYREPEAG